MSSILQTMIDKYSNVAMNIFDALVVFLIGWYGTKYLVKIVKRMLTNAEVDPIVSNFLGSIAMWALRIIVIITAISTLGVSTTSLVAVLTTASAAIVLGMQDYMKGIVSGFVILLAKPFVKGDLIEINGYLGKIEEIQMLYTFLITFDNKMVVIPNNDLAGNVFVNYSHEDTRRVDIELEVDYRTDVELAKRLILEVVQKHPMTLENPIPYARVSKYGDSAITITLRVWTQTDHYYALKDDLMEQIKAIFDQNDISIPFPQVDVHMDA
ncbi:MAG: mechanosensitive ion channel [Erysipelotrichaceae bacterium]|nr:mechanosensitive ion channel [Erysipelotrichaceae bacterium]